MKRAWAAVALWLTAMVCGAASAGTVTYYHNDLAGSPVVATNASGQVIWRESYRPYGERLTNSTASTTNDVWFTSRRQDADIGLVYMGARYYDPVIGRFISTDPKGFDEANVHSFNRYAYANNNPFRYTDPDGKQAVPALTAPPRAATAVSPFPLVRPSEQQQIRALEGYASYGAGSLSLPSLDAADVVSFMLGGFAGAQAGKISGMIFNSNPFAGPVDESVVVVDSRGNAIPVERGQRLGASPDSKWIEVKDANGIPTGTRLDNGHKSHDDLRGREPHGHREGVTNQDGTPWLPVNK